MGPGGWRLEFDQTESLPVFAWLMHARPGHARLSCGPGVRSHEAGIFEGTWVGEAGDLGPLHSTTPFGSGVLLTDGSLVLVTPGHMLEGVYVCRREKEVIASNSLVGLLAGAGLELDPRVLYPPLFDRSVRGGMRTTIPTTTDPIEACFHDNLRLDLGGRLTAVAKLREKPFTDFRDYRGRLSAALASAMANSPTYQPAVTISSGYDGAAVGALAAELGCRLALTIGEGKRVRESSDLGDSGESVGRMLGMDVEVFERLAYLRRDDRPEADFLATGFTGEEVVMSGMDSTLRGRMLVSGFFGDGMWWLNRPTRPVLWRSDQSGSSLGEWRLRTGFVHVPLPCFGGERYPDTARISHSAEMDPWRLGRRYDKPIPRRIPEEAGVPRGTFGEVKRAASGTIHVDGPEMISPASRASLADFAARQGDQVEFHRRTFNIWDRALLKIGRWIGAQGIASRAERNKHRLGVLEPHFGSLLLRWATDVVRPRYDGIDRSNSG